MYVCMYVCMYIFIYRNRVNTEREREKNKKREREREREFSKTINIIPDLSRHTDCAIPRASLIFDEPDYLDDAKP